jgi:hypothetical protein
MSKLRVLATAALSLLLTTLPAAAQEEEQDPHQIFQEALDAPYPVADQSVAEWWNRTTVDWRLEPAIWQAYEEFWKLRSDALFDLNPAKLETRMAGPALERELAGIEMLKSQGAAQVIDIEHRAQVLEATADEGVVWDPYLNRTYRIDATSKKRVEPEFEPYTIDIAYRLQPIDGVWKVVDAVRLVDEEP